MKFAPIALITVMLVGCSNYSQVVKSNLSGTSQLMIQTPTTNPKQGNNIKVKVTVDTATSDEFLPKVSAVEKEKTLILPLLIWTYWDHVTVHKLGRNQIAGSVFEHISLAFEQALTMSGYVVSDKNPEIEITIKPKLAKSSSRYEKSGYFYFLLVAYGFAYGDNAGPYKSEIRFEVETKHNGKLFRNEIAGQTSLDYGAFGKSDSEIERVTNSFEYSLKKSIENYLKTLPPSGAQG